MKELNFNSVQRPSLVLTMKDEEQTVLHVAVPKESLVEELQQMARELSTVVKTGDADGMRAVYDLAARLMSCNRDLIKVTADDLKSKYDLDFEDIVLFFRAYIDFIAEITSAKN